MQRRKKIFPRGFWPKPEGFRAAKKTARKKLFRGKSVHLGAHQRLSDAFKRLPIQHIQAY